MERIALVFKKNSSSITRISSFFTFLFLLSIFGAIDANAQSTKEFRVGGDTLIVYADVPGLASSGKFTIRVRSAATNYQWVDVFAHYTYSRGLELPDINQADGTNSSTNVQHYPNFTAGWSHTYGNIEMSRNQPVEVEIAAKNGFKIGGNDFLKAAIHPAHKAGTPMVIGNKIYFTLNNPAQVVIDINGQMDDYNALTNPIGSLVHTITMFTNPILKKPSLNGSRVHYVEPGVMPTIDYSSYDTLYFKPGIHDIGMNNKVLPGKKVYIPGDAIIYGTLNNLDVPLGEYTKIGEKIRIYGYGTISGEKITHPLYVSTTEITNLYKPIMLDQALDYEVYGVTIIDPANHSCFIPAGVAGAVRWAKVIGWRANSDGFAGNDNVDDCFMRTSDDASYVRGNKSRCIFWKDHISAIFYMAYIPNKPLLIEDCDVVYLRSRDSDGANGGLFNVRGDSAGYPGGTYPTNVTFRNFRIHDSLANMCAFNMVSYKGSAAAPTGVGFSYNGLRFENISFKSSRVKQILMGCAASPWYGGVTFDNVSFGGNLLTQPNFSTYFNSNEYVRDLIFQSSSVAVTGVSISGNSLTSLLAGTYSHLTPVVLPVNATNKGVSWSSSDTTIATVTSKGLVKAKKAGTVTITVTTNDQNLTASCTITVISGGSGSVNALTGWVSGNLNPKVSGSNRLMTVMVMGESNTNFSATGVTYGGQPMVKQSERIYYVSGNRSYASIFTLNESGVEAATSGTIVVSWSSTPSVGSSVYSVLLADVDQTTPVSATANNALSGTSISTAALAPANGDLVIMCGATENNIIQTFNNGFIKQFESNTSWGDGVGGYKMGTGSSEIPKFTQSASGRMVLCAMVIKKSVATPVFYDLTASAANGTVYPAIGSYFAGSKVIITATPASGYEFTGWSGDLTGTANPDTIIMDGHKNIIANFKQSSVSLSSTSANGSVMFEPAGPDYPVGTEVTITAIPDSDYKFSSWSGSLISNSNPETVIMTGNKNVAAHFIPIFCTLVTSATNGTVTPSDGTFDGGTTVTVTATPASGYRFSSWSGDLTGTANPETLLMDCNKNITAIFTRITYTLSTTSPNGSVVLEPNGPDFPEGTEVQITAVPNSGYLFSGWSGDLTGTANPGIITMDGNKSITAEFVPITYSFTANATNGTVTPSGGTYNAGTMVTVTATPASGYRFSSWSGDITGTTNPETIVMDGNKNVTAVFTQITYTLSATSLNGSFTFEPAGPDYPAGTEVIITAIPADDYKFSRWSGDLTGTTNPAAIIMDGNKNIAANFIPIFCTLTTNATNGTVTPADGTFDGGTPVTVTATPASGYRFSNWSGDLTGTANPETLVMDGNKNITANFTVIIEPPVTALTGWVSGTTNNKVAGSNRLMTVMVMGEHSSNFSATGATYGGRAMTKQTERLYYVSGYRTYAAIFTLNEAGVNAATNGTIAVSWSTKPSSGSSMYSVLLGNVNQTTPVGAKANNGLTGTSITTTALAAATGDMAIMCGATENNITQTFNNGFTKQFESNSSWGDGVGGNKMGTGVNETPKFTQSASGRMAICAVVVKKYQQ